MNFELGALNFDFLMKRVGLNSQIQMLIDLKFKAPSSSTSAEQLTI